MKLSHSLYSEFNSLQNVFWKLSEWCYFETCLWDDPHTCQFATF